MLDFNRKKYVDTARIAALVDASEFDAVIVTAPENVPYFSGFYNQDIRSLPERGHYVLWPSGGEPVFVAVAKRKKLMQPGQTFVEDMRTYEGEGLDAMRALAAAMIDRGVAKGRIGIEGRSFPGGYLLDLLRRLPGITVSDARPLLERIRAVKTPGEIETLTKIGRITTEAIDAGFRAARIGDTERSIATRIQTEMFANGVEMLAHVIFGSGTRTGEWHTLPTDKPIQEGEVVKCDFGGFMDGYYSDVARTAVMGRSTSEQREQHAKVTAIKDGVVGAIRPGVPASEIALLAQKLYADNDLEFKWNIVGHGLGLAVHEEPQIYSWVHEEIVEGQVMAIELGYTDPPNDSYQIEDLIVVEAGGARYLTDTDVQRQMWELGT